MQIDVTKFNPNWFKIRIEYASWYVIQEFIVVIMGVLANSLFFFLMMLTSYFSVRCCRKFPPILSKIFAWYGIGTILDWVLVLIVDLID